MINFQPELESYRTVRQWMEDGRDLRALLLAQETAARTYSALVRQLPERCRRTLEQLIRESQAHRACLEGICLLVTGEVPQIRASPSLCGATAATLRQCYGKAMRMLVTYEARQQDPEYGPVFRRMAAQQQAHCQAILELLGHVG